MLMEFLQPGSLAEAIAAKAASPDALPIAGGTDVMVDLNFARRRPPVLLDLTCVPELAGWSLQDGRLRVGAGVTYAELTGERDSGRRKAQGQGRGADGLGRGADGLGRGADGLGQGADGLGRLLPGLAMAARTVGSPQIRNRGTVGGNLGTASPAGDGLPPLYVAGAEVELASVGGVRRVAIDEFITGPKRTCAREDELISAFVLPAASGAQQFAKIGTRNAMVIAVCSVALAIWPERRAVRVCIGSAGPTPLRAPEAEALAEASLDWDGLGPADDAVTAQFGELVAAAAQPIDDVRGSAAYRRRAIDVLGRRTLGWAWEEQRCA
jgi:CO/xanthine dehydrogenase FAD-binding subunit